MRAMSNKRVIVTQNQMINFAGSEMVTLELVEECMRQGAEVILAVNALGDPMMSRLNKIKGLRTYTLPSDELDELLNQKPADIAWIHHQLIPPVLLERKAIQYTKYIFHHMSPYHPTEFPVFAQLEEGLADMILFNSPETESEILRQGVLDVSHKRMDIFGNPAPDEFLRKGSERVVAKEPKNIIVVTNHIVDELIQANDILRKNGTKVDVLGAQTGNYQQLTPQILARYDAVITIGKTVQYALLFGIPTYCYDHFGGPGYITRENFESSRLRNFSGRNGSKKTADEIAREITEGYLDAAEFFSNPGTHVLDSFTLSKRLHSVINTAYSLQHTHVIPRPGQIVGLGKVNELNRTIQDILRTSDREYNTLKGKYEQINEAYLNRTRDYEKLLKEYNSVRLSMAYRVGTIIAFPVRGFRRLLKFLK